MKKFKNLFIIIFVFLLSITLFAENSTQKKEIRAIEVQGLKNVKQRVVKNVIKIDTGEDFDQKLVDEDISAIYKLGYFSDVAADVSDYKDGVKVIFIVQEKLIVKKIDFKGNKEYSSRKLRSEISTKEKEGYDIRKIKDDIEKINTLYKDKGYADVRVEDYSTTDESTGFANVTFSIAEGNKILIGDVNIEGIKSFKYKKIKKLFTTKKKKVYKEETFKDDMKKVEAFYKDNGHINIKILEPGITYDESRTKMYIRVIIDEGRKYVNGKVSFTGNTIFTESQLIKVFNFKQNVVYSQSKYDESEGNLKSLYADRGYIRSKFEPEIIKNDETGIVDIKINIIENGVVYIDKIYIDGNTKTKDYVIKRELLVKQGDVFAVGRIRRSQERLYNLGFFKDVKVDIEETKEVDKADLAIEVEEDKTGLVSLGAGYSSVDKVVGTVQVTETNLFGKGQRLNLTYEFGARKQNYEIGFTEPYLFGKKLLFGVDIFNTTAWRTFGTDINAYQERRRGGDIRIGKPLSDILSLNFTYAYEEVRVFNIDIGLVNQIQSTEDIASSLTSAITRDTRDNVFDTTRGSRHSLSVKVAGGPFGGNTHFYKPNLSLSKFIPTFWKFIIGLNTRISFVKEFPPSKDVPIYERFILGGADTVRGYDFGEIGPPEKGKIIFISNLEYKFPIIEENNRSVLSAVLFADMGGSWRGDDDLSLKIGPEERQIKTGVGFGIRLRPMPVLPIRIDWGYGLNHRPGEQLSQFYFTMGQIF
ncbi:MAG: outer membrane protein assembly factor BamA [Elusimicrobia bacterium RIFOXYD2_FULL_34_15]|nr:MAG: outer membrane protein assembly factor BamA [Elusimicrobia bacterium RIFOXYD2_FULL_34_15]